MDISLVVAVAHDHAIGKDGCMPWHIPEELQYFKAITLGKPVVMGRTTFESIGKPLPGRENIVITSRPDTLPETVVAMQSPEAALAYVRQQGVAEVMVIGGGQIYKALLPLATRLYMTQIHQSYDADTFFPTIDWQDWVLEETEEKEGVRGDRIRYTTQIYQKKR